MRLGPAPVLPVTPPDPGPVDWEVAAAIGAIESVAADLEARSRDLVGEARDILHTQVMMARDPGLADGIRAAVQEGKPAAWGVHDAFATYLDALGSVGGYLGDRVSDLVDLRDRVIAALLGVPAPGIPESAHPFVLVAVDLAPADTVTLDPARVLAIVTEKGGPTSHTAILARALGIPAVVGCVEASRLTDGDQVVVDGARGVVVLNPREEQLTRAARESDAQRQALARYSGPGATSDGHPVKLLLNIGGAGDLSAAAAADAEGVGLFRTEFLFLDRATAPTVAEQRAAYGQVFSAFDGRPVVVRTLDAGADKPVPFANDDTEPNPALGVRGYRIAQRKPELLSEQLTAIALAAQDYDADVRVMAPMIATAAEAREFVAQARAAGIGTAGVMIEIPAAALRAKEILAEVDFVSIGTNDLSQYTFAADRLLGDLGPLLDPWQPALLELVRSVADAARQVGKPAGVCGEAAGDPGLALVLAGMGITSLSMSAPAVPAVRAALREHTLGTCAGFAEQALRAAGAGAARSRVLGP